jgi:O-antigen/teichoic acid export membrane protein
LWVHLRQDHLVKNAFFIALSNASMGVLGFLFWILAARLFPPGQVGLATTLVSGAVLIAYASQLGFNNTFVRYLPVSSEPDAEISTGLVLVFLSALVIGTVYVVVVPSSVPQLHFLRTNLVEAGLMVVFTAFGAVNLVTDAVFIAYRSAFYNFVVDGVLQSIIRLGAPALLVGLGAFGLFAAFGVASTAAVIASIVLMVAKFSYHPRPVVSLRVVRRVFRFGSANYVAALLTMVPILLLPIIVVRDVGAAAGGYFYLALQMANLLFNASLAACQSLFAEGSNRVGNLRHLAARSVRIQVYLLLPLAVFMAGTGHWILVIFGRSYAAHGTLTLAVLAASTPGVILNYWTSTLLRIRHQLLALIVSNVVLAAVTCGLAAWWVGRGIAWVALAWLIGNLASGIVGGLPLLRPAPPAPMAEGDGAGPASVGPEPARSMLESTGRSGPPVPSPTAVGP